MDNEDVFIRAKKRLDIQLLKVAILKQECEGMLRSRLARSILKDDLYRSYAGICVMLGENLCDRENLKRFKSTQNSSLEALDMLKERLCEVFRKEKRKLEWDVNYLQDRNVKLLKKMKRQDTLTEKLIVRIKHYLAENKEYAQVEKMLRFRLQSVHANNAELLKKIRYLRNAINLRKEADRMNNERDNSRLRGLDAMHNENLSLMDRLDQKTTLTEKLIERMRFYVSYNKSLECEVQATKMMMRAMLDVVKEVKPEFNQLVFKPILNAVGWYMCRECGYETQERLSQCPACEEAYGEKLKDELDKEVVEEKKLDGEYVYECPSCEHIMDTPDNIPPGSIPTCTKCGSSELSRVFRVVPDEIYSPDTKGEVEQHMDKLADKPDNVLNKMGATVVGSPETIDRLKETIEKRVSHYHCSVCDHIFSETVMNDTDIAEACPACGGYLHQEHSGSLEKAHHDAFVEESKDQNLECIDEGEEEEGDK